MENRAPFDRDHHHFVMSYELLKLLEWFIKHEQENLKLMIKNALQKGFSIDNVAQQNDQNPEILQQSIIDFFALIDSLLHETIMEDEATQVLQRALIPAIKNIDATMYDQASMETSIAKARAALSDAHGKDPKDVLCRELLRRWKPVKKTYMH